MSDSLTLSDILEARRLMREGRPWQPYILSGTEALRWCHLSDHRLAVCSHCRGDHEACRRILNEEHP